MGTPLTDDQMLAQMNSKPLSDDEMMAQMGKPQNATHDEDDTVTGTAKRWGGNALSGVGKALGYVGGLSRTALSGYAGMANPNILKSGDFTRALQGNAPSTAEYLERAGVPQGPTMSKATPWAFSDPGSGGLTSLHLPEKGGPFDVSARGAAGMVGDIATDPTTYLTFGAGSGAKALANGVSRSPWALAKDVAMRPAAEAGEALGQKIYQGAFKNVDKDLVNKLGKAPISPELLQSGFWGNMNAAKTSAEGLADRAGKDIGNTYATAAGKGATVNMMPALDNAMLEASNMRSSPHLDVQAAGHKLDDLTQSYLERGESVPVDTAHDWASEANRLAGKRAFSPMQAGTITNQDKIERAIGQGLQEQSMKAVGEVAPELGQNLVNNNRIYSSAVNAEPSFVREANKEATKNWLSQVDGMLVGASGSGALLHSPKAMMMAGAILAAKKAAQAANSTLGRTAVGQGLYQGSKYVAPVLNQPSTWQFLNNNKPQGE